MGRDDHMRDEPGELLMMRSALKQMCSKTKLSGTKMLGFLRICRVLNGGAVGRDDEEERGMLEKKDK